MSRQFRYRVTAIVLGGVIFGAPMLVNGMASADQVIEQGTQQVIFEGGSMLGLSCRSQPDIESMTVPAESTVRLVNRTGYSARLELDGDEKGTLPDDSATDVIFRRGSTSVTLKPNCALGEDVAPVVVTAAPSASAAVPDPTPAPSRDTSDSAAAASDSSEPAPSGSGVPDAATPAERPSRVTRRGAVRMDASQTSAVPATVTSHGAAALRNRVKSDPSPRTAEGRAPAFSGMPPGDRKAIMPAVPQVDVAPMTQDAVPAAVAAPPAQVAAAEPVAAMEPIGEGGPIGMLAMVAAVCVLGVGAAAIRAIVSQRANRAKLA